jgi:methylmalonyl-CoA epimerase
VYRDLLGLPLETIMDIESDHVRIAFLGVGESKVELVEPTDDTTGVARFLANKGEGFHHVCFEVANLAEELTRLGIDGVELIDSRPARGARARRVPAPAELPRRARRADRGAGRAGVDEPRVSARRDAEAPFESASSVAGASRSPSASRCSRCCSSPGAPPS